MLAIYPKEGIVQLVVPDYHIPGIVNTNARYIVVTGVTGMLYQKSFYYYIIAANGKNFVFPLPVKYRKSQLPLR